MALVAFPDERYNKPKLTTTFSDGILDWPGNSPDLYPIENLWSVFKRRVGKQKPTNCDQFPRTNKECGT
uniref:Tc1-like transposase DDE domain-containing protein n=1 Tax=Cyprinus carpio TaxID=7962 RepID=A0A8C1LG47_CYPCA